VNNSGIPIQVNHGCVIASIQIDLNEPLLNAFRMELLEFCSKTELNGIILELSGQKVIDNYDFNNIRKIIDCAKVMGYESVISGLNPGVVASLVMMDANLDGILASKNLDGAIFMLNKNNAISEPEEVENDDKIVEEDEYDCD
jgi:rsbT antagonist protein RsbS